MAINLIITDAGRAQLINASNTGTNLITLSHVAFGSGKNVSTADQTELQNEFKRLSTISGSAVADDTLHVMISDDTTASYAFSEFGLFTDTGVLFAVYAQSTNIMNKTSAASLRLAVDIVLESLDASVVNFGDTNFLIPPATTTTAGVAKIAYNTDTDAGTNNTKIITPLRLQRKINALLDGVDASLNTFKKMATALAGKLGKTETAVNSENLNGAVDSISADINTVVKRDGGADIHARLFRSNFSTQTTTPASTAQVMIRNKPTSTSTDDYQRPISRSALLNYLIADGGLQLVLARRPAGGDVGYGGIVSGNTLVPVSAKFSQQTDWSVYAPNVGAALTGTWKCLGHYDHAYGTSGNLTYGATLWVRVSY